MHQQCQNTSTEKLKNVNIFNNESKQRLKTAAEKPRVTVTKFQSNTSRSRRPWNNLHVKFPFSSLHKQAHLTTPLIKEQLLIVYILFFNAGKIFFSSTNIFFGGRLRFVSHIENEPKPLISLILKGRLKANRDNIARYDHYSSHCVPKRQGLRGWAE
ncbi:hypothetical protein CEXT_183991 [Caerostris extrusa]|uniref:Uncharacterized protein n=1 Tax=Caerostris extrusa TaxID=172846 RepID=A0AAV4XQG2_CAEEX|nr:hypothetical protein CEXT_183991 [Caerostris extrusa]